MPNAVLVLIFSISSFVFLFIIAKILGKKQIAELDFIDYVVGISLGSIAAQWSTDSDGPWYHYVIAMSVFLLLDLLITVLSRTVPFLKKSLAGSPLVLMADGEFIFDNLKKSKLSVNNLLGLARSKGYFNMIDIAYIVLETNGQISILPKKEQRPAIASDIAGAPLQEPSLPNLVIIDGRVFDDTLSNLGKSRDWLFKTMGVSEENIDNILLSVYDEKQNTFKNYYKSSLNAELPVK